MTKIERWKPEDDQKYYFINNMLTVSKNNYIKNYEFDDLRYQNGNCFKTEAEAQAAAAKVKALLLSLHEPVTNCNQLPKLTTEVFDSPDCPEWAKYAAVDADGDGFYYEEKPRVCEADGEWLVDKCITGLNRIISGDFTPYDWQNSLIERPAKLPEWCKVGEWVYYNDSLIGDTYAKVKEITDKAVIVAGRMGDVVLARNDIQSADPARLRQYNSDEMRSLVGKVLKDNDDNLFLATSYLPHRGGLLIGGYYYNAGELLDGGLTIDGKPCGVLEHQEDGEWVE